ncbi:MAG: hypothetical protein LC624_11425 [Halobacteriales archaeon]|nr:hypothetical protein [Halobacteriales archaeon]
MSLTPFDDHAARADANGFHNHRDNSHSDLISDGITRDLRAMCEPLRRHLDEGVVGAWKNQPNPWGRKRNTDLVVAEPAARVGVPIGPTAWRGAASVRGLRPDSARIRVVVEHKSVITAHRNRSARHDDLNNLWQEAAQESHAVIAATVMIGLAPKVLNVPDRIMPRYYAQTEMNGRVARRFDAERFEREVLSRIHAHDAKLWSDFPEAVSYNTPQDIETTIAKFATLPIRPVTRATPGLDALLLVPVMYDNVNTPTVGRQNRFGLDVDVAYARFLERIASAYVANWGP